MASPRRTSYGHSVPNDPPVPPNATYTIQTKGSLIAIACDEQPIGIAAYPERTIKRCRLT